jgi:hypothetical protein
MRGAEARRTDWQRVQFSTADFIAEHDISGRRSSRT